MDDLDRILSSDSRPEPSPSFTASVMAAVEREAAAPAAIPFPWARVAAGAAAIAAASGMAVLLGPHLPSWSAPRAVGEAVVAVLTKPATMPALAWTAGALLLSWATVGVALRLSPNRV